MKIARYRLQILVEMECRWTPLMFIILMTIMILLTNIQHHSTHSTHLLMNNIQLAILFILQKKIWIRAKYLILFAISEDKAEKMFLQAAVLSSWALEKSSKSTGASMAMWVWRVDGFLFEFHQFQLRLRWFYTQMGMINVHSPFARFLLVSEAVNFFLWFSHVSPTPGQWSSMIMTDHESWIECFLFSKSQCKHPRMLIQLAPFSDF